MAELTIDITYGTALFEAAVETGKEAVILEEATELLAVFQQETALRDFINYPAIPAEEKKAVLEKVFAGRICDELLNFLCILVDKRRTMRLEKIIKAYRKLMDQQIGRSYGTVYSVEPLGEDRIRELEEQTSRLFQANVSLTNETDPSLIGGVKILVEGKLIDASVRKKFDDLERQMNFS